MQDCLAGREASAAAKLRALGCRYALAPGVWANGMAGASAVEGTAAPLQTKSRSSFSGTCMVADRGLPPRLLARLTTAFAPGAAYWRNHAYDDPSTPFFSYVFALPTTGHAGSDADGSRGDGSRFPVASPSNALEAAALLLQRRCAATVAATAAAAAAAGPAACGRDSKGGLGAESLEAVLAATHVEFWAHTRGLDAPHQLHFDGEPLWGLSQWLLSLDDEVGWNKVVLLIILRS